MAKKVFINLLIGVFVFGFFSLAQAAKPQNSGSGKDVIAMSNGFPSGLHFNLNVHGKKDDYVCQQSTGGKSVFIPLYGPSEIQYVSNKKSKNYELYVIDSCSNDFLNPPDDDPIKVFLPHKVQPDELAEAIPADGYYVFARILGKPNNGNTQEASNIILYPNSVVSACNDSGVDSDTFGEYTDCEGDLALGLIVGDNVYQANPADETYVRFDPGATGGKGKSRATDITRLFIFSGWVLNESLDTSGPAGVPDGIIDINDVPIADYGINLPGANHDYNNDGVENNEDVLAWLTYLLNNFDDQAWYFENVWIHNIADSVITEQGLVNDGTKLLQIRFYPVSTTEYVAP